MTNEPTTPGVSNLETFERHLRDADEAFTSGTVERLEKGAETYGPVAFLSVDTLEEAMAEVLDLANYARFTYIKLYLLQKSIARIVKQNPAADAQGFISTKELFNS